MNDSSTAPTATRTTLHRAKEAARHEMRRFAVMFLYLWVLFGFFALLEDVILSQHGIAYAFHGFAIINAAVLGKVMLLAEKMRLARWFESRPLIWAILAESAILSLLFIVTHVLEHLVGGMIGGEKLAASVPAIGGGGIGGLVCVAVILFVAMIPFFGFHYIAREVGPDRIKAILFHPRHARHAAGSGNAAAH